MIFIHGVYYNADYVYVFATCKSTEKTPAWYTEQKLIIEIWFSLWTTDPNPLA